MEQLRLALSGEPTTIIHSSIPSRPTTAGRTLGADTDGYQTHPSGREDLDGTGEEEIILYPTLKLGFVS